MFTGGRYGLHRGSAAARTIAGEFVRRVVLQSCSRAAHAVPRAPHTASHNTRQSLRHSRADRPMRVGGLGLASRSLTWARPAAGARGFVVAFVVSVWFAHAVRCGRDCELNA